MAAAEGVETDPVASYWISSEERSARRMGVENSFTEPTRLLVAAKEADEFWS